MIGWFFWGAMYMARVIEYAVKAGWSLIVSLVWFLPLVGLGATESGVDCHVFGIISVAPMLIIFIASGLAISVLCFGSARIAGTVAAACKPAIFARAKAGHECREGCHRFRLFLS